MPETAGPRRERQEDMLKLSSRVKTIEEDADDLGTMIRAIRKNRGGEGVYLVTHSDATTSMSSVLRRAARMLWSWSAGWLRRWRRAETSPFPGFFDGRQEWESFGLF